MTGVAVLLTVIAGLAGSVQVAVMGRFGGRIGVIEALTFSTAVQLLLSATILVVARMGFGGLGGAFRTPAWMWLGGLMGLTVVGTITFAQPRIGATATIGILIAGQLVMGALIDRYGLFGVERIDISLPRAIGIVLLGIGAGLSLVLCLIWLRRRDPVTLLMAAGAVLSVLYVVAAPAFSAFRLELAFVPMAAYAIALATEAVVARIAGRAPAAEHVAVGSPRP